MRRRVRFLFLILLATVVPSATANAGLLGQVGDDSCIRVVSSTLQVVYFCDADIRPTGTGVFNPFLRVNRDGTGGNPTDDTKATYSSGWNTDATHQDGVDGYNDFDASWTRSLLLSEVGLTNSVPTGTWIDPNDPTSSYARLTVDINQVSSNGGSILSLNQLILHNCTVDVNGSAAGNPYTTLAAGGCTSFFDLFGNDSDFVNFDYRLHTGSGSGDVDVYIQNTGFSGPYLALLDGWGCGSGTSIQPPQPCTSPHIASDNDGFQEWATTMGPAPPPAIPEPASLLLLGTGLSAMGVVARRRRKAKAEAEKQS